MPLGFAGFAGREARFLVSFVVFEWDMSHPRPYFQKVSSGVSSESAFPVL